MTSDQAVIAGALGGLLGVAIGTAAGPWFYWTFVYDPPTYDEIMEDIRAEEREATPLMTKIRLLIHDMECEIDFRAAGCPGPPGQPGEWYLP